VQQHEGFVALQVRFNGCATVTISKDNPEEIKADLLALGLSSADADKILNDAGRRFLEALEPKEGNDNKPGPKTSKPAVEEGPKCGHGIRRAKRQGKNGPFWSCVAKDENGDFLWKKKEGCEPIWNYQEGLDLMKEQGLA
jgi:hypothetical protein